LVLNTEQDKCVLINIPK